jgi:uroporphyrinogen decarboxylase
MNSRERALRALRCEPTDRPPFDLIEGAIWPELLDYFRKRRGLGDAASVIEFLDPDFRWPTMPDQARDPSEVWDAFWRWIDDDYRKGRARGPLAGAQTVAEVEAFGLPDPARWSLDGLAEKLEAARARWPDKALVYFCPILPLFWTACEIFGAEEALVKIVAQPAVYEALISRLQEIDLEVLRKVMPVIGRFVDAVYWWDDFASQEDMLISPDLWRRAFKIRLGEQVEICRENGLHVLFHSCGAVRPVLPDLIDVGVSALAVFQTTARGMDPESIARDLGGQLAFYGGIDVQQLLSFGSPAQVAAEVERNVRAFSDCGGYIVANAHFGLATIRGENIEAMCEAARTASASPV